MKYAKCACVLCLIGMGVLFITCLRKVKENQNQMLKERKANL